MRRFNSTWKNIKKQQLFENSLIIISADHGEAFGEHNTVKHYKTVYEEMIRIPMLVMLPGLESRTINHQVGLEDLYATRNELFQLGNSSPALRSTSLLPLLTRGDKAASKNWYYRRANVAHTFFSIRGTEYKYVRNHFRDELYDLGDDPAELKDIASQEPVLTSYLRTKGRLIVVQDLKFRRTLGESERYDKDLDDELKNLGYLN